jgi:AraC-like DNA-binding protein
MSAPLDYGAGAAYPIPDRTANDRSDSREILGRLLARPCARNLRIMSAAARFSDVPRASGGMTRLAVARLRERAVNVAPVLRRAGLSASEVDDPNARLSVAGQIKFLEAAAEALEDPLLGFHLAREFELRQIGLVYFVMASSATLVDALNRAERYGKVVNEGLLLSCVPGRELKVRLTHFGVSRHSDRQQIEFFVTALVRVCRRLTGQDVLSPSVVRLAHSRSDDMSEVEKFIGAAIQFDAGVDEVALPQGVEHQSLPNADLYLNELLTRYCDEALASRPKVTSALRSRVENAVVPLLPHGTPTARQVAAAIGMSYRTLARRLAAEQLTFADILSDLRANLADRYLQDADVTISQIAWLLGYREVSSFTNAYKKRTGLTPTRQRLRETSRQAPAG